MIWVSRRLLWPMMVASNMRECQDVPELGHACTDEVDTNYIFVICKRMSLPCVGERHGEPLIVSPFRPA